MLEELIQQISRENKMSRILAYSVFFPIVCRNNDNNNNNCNNNNITIIMIKKNCQSYTNSEKNQWIVS